MSARKNPKFTALSGHPSGLVLTGNNDFLDLLEAVIEQAARCEEIGTPENALAEALRRVKAANAESAKKEAAKRAARRTKKNTLKTPLRTPAEGL